MRMPTRPPKKPSYVNLVSNESKQLWQSAAAERSHNQLTDTAAGMYYISLCKGDSLGMVAMDALYRCI